MAIKPSRRGSPVQLLVFHLESLHCSEVIVPTLIGDLLQRSKFLLISTLACIIAANSKYYPVKKIPGVGSVDGGKLLLHPSKEDNAPPRISLPKVCLFDKCCSNHFQHCRTRLISDQLGSTLLQWHVSENHQWDKHKALAMVFPKSEKWQSWTLAMVGTSHSFSSPEAFTLTSLRARVPVHILRGSHIWALTSVVVLLTETESIESRRVDQGLSPEHLHILIT